VVVVVVVVVVVLGWEGGGVGHWHKQLVRCRLGKLNSFSKSGDVWKNQLGRWQESKMLLGTFFW